MRGEYGVTAPVNKAEDIILRDFFAEANATGTKDATFIIKSDARSELDRFRLLDFVLQKTRGGIAEFDTEFLQTTFSRLIANRTIQRMIDQEKFHHAALTFAD